MKASELQLKFPKDSLQGLKQNFHKKESYHAVRVDTLVKKQIEHPNFHTEFTSMSVSNVYEMLRPSSAQSSLVKGAKADKLARSINTIDKKEKEALFKSRQQFWKSASSREFLSVQCDRQIR